MPVNDFLPIATDVAANVDTQAAYAGSTYQKDGQQTGIAISKQFNKMWRQGSVASAIIGQLINSVLGEDFLDNGDEATQASQLQALITTLGASVSSPQQIDVPFSATPAFNAAVGNLLHPLFVLTLTGNVTSSTLTGITKGQLITVIIRQDSTGGRTFTPPPLLPMDPIDTTANAVNIQSFHVWDTGAPLHINGVVPASPLIVA